MREVFMNWLARHVGLFWLLAGAFCLPAAAEYRVVSWRELADRDLSPLGRVVMRGNTRAWTHAESDRFIFHTAKESLLGRVAHEADWCFDEIGRRLDLSEPPQRARFFIFDSVSEWQQYIQASARGRASVAAHVGREVYIRRAPEDRTQFVDLAHELVHLRLWQEYGSGIPLWLDEGLAEYVGWQVAAAYYLRHRELRLYRDFERIAEEQWLPWDLFFALRYYPEDAERNRVFYRQSYQLVRYLNDRIGEDQLSELVRQVIAAQGDLESVVAQHWGWTEVDWDAALK